MTSILIIDDEAELRDEIKAILTFEGFDVLDAPDGISGVQIANDQLPDLIICDVSMPNLNGFEVLETLQQDSQTAFIPFIFLTAFADYENQRRGMALGADDYLSKPFLRQDLLNAIQSRLDKHHQQQLHQLRSFSQSLVEQQENERKYLSNYLHDEVGQSLMGLKVLLETSSKLPPNAINRMLEDANDILQTVLDRLQDVSDTLYPVMLQHLGLLPALYWYIENFTRQTQIEVVFQHADIPSAIPQKVKLAAYRILQEALTNAAAHAAVRQVSAQVWTEDNLLALHIYDEGQGFALEAARRKGRGLINMQERAIALEGECIITSTPNEGTQVTVRIPLQPDTLAEAAHVHTLAGHQTQHTITPPMPPTDERIPLLLVEENPLICRGICNIVEDSARFTVIDAAGNTEYALSILAERHIPIVLFSLTATQQNCFDVLRQFTKHSPQPAVIALSPYHQDVYVRATFEHGANGYLLKNVDSDEFLYALEQVYQGKHYHSKSLTVQPQASPATQDTSDAIDAFATLTRREKEIFYRVVNGMSNQQIADELVISPRTVETHRSNMMHKLGVRGQAALMHYALNRGLIAPNTPTH